MKHASTRAVFDTGTADEAWRGLSARVRTSIRAIFAMSSVTPFMLAADFVDGIRFRLAGTRFARCLRAKSRASRLMVYGMKASRERLDGLDLVRS